MDYVLPFRGRFSRTEVLRLPTRSPSARGTLYFGRRSFPVDRIAYFGIFLEGWYRTDYRDAVVLDIGAHKGYYGAFALLEGAREVHSFEPEPTNFGLLERPREPSVRAGSCAAPPSGPSPGPPRCT